jgi:hypothetical protein
MYSLAQRIVAVLVLGSALLGASVWTNEAPKLTLEQKVHQADLVGVGRVTAVNVADPRRKGLEHIATIRIHTLLKGTAESSISLVYDTGIYEIDPQCCVSGATYLFFLKRDSRGLFTSINGPRGVYRIDTQSWPYEEQKP